MIKAPDNIIIVTLPRTGSTSLIFKLVRSMQIEYGEDEVARLGEAASSAGVLGLKHYAVQRLLNESNYADAVKFNHWQIADGRLFMAKEEGDPRDEMQNRINIVMENWTNHAVIKHIISQDHESVHDLNMSFYDGENSKFHNVLLWRKDIHGMICSRYVSERTRRRARLASSWVGNSAHGVYEWDGVYIGNPEKTNYNDSFISYTRSLIDSYMRTCYMLPKDKTVLIETKSIDSVVDIAWPDGALLTNIDQLKTDRTESNKYINTYDTSQQLKPRDMIHPEILSRIDELVDAVNRDHDWQNLDRHIGIKQCR